MDAKQFSQSGVRIGSESDFSKYQVAIAPGLSMEIDDLYRIYPEEFQQYEIRVVHFQSRLRTWCFQYAKLLSDGKREFVHIVGDPALSETVAKEFRDRAINDSGFAILALVMPYVEIIGRLCGEFPQFPCNGSRAITTSEFVEEGLRWIIPELFDQEDSGVYVTLLKNALRNSIAHTFFIGQNVILSGLSSDILVLGKLNGNAAIRLNPRAFCARCEEHFNMYLSQLKSEADGVSALLRTRFIQRYPDGLKLFKDKDCKKTKSRK